MAGSFDLIANERTNRESSPLRKLILTKLKLGKHCTNFCRGWWNNLLRASLIFTRFHFLLLFFFFLFLGEEFIEACSVINRNVESRDYYNNNNNQVCRVLFFFFYNFNPCLIIYLIYLISLAFNKFREIKNH